MPGEDPWFRFASFIEENTFDSDNQLGGQIKASAWNLTASDLLVPVSSIILEVYDDDDDSYPAGVEVSAHSAQLVKFIGHSVDMFVGEMHVFGCSYVRGEWLKTITDGAPEDFPEGETFGPRLISQLERYKALGQMTLMH